MSHLSCFKAYDVRGKIGTELTEEIIYRIGRAFAQHLNAKCIVVGADIRLTSESFKKALSMGIMDNGTDVIDIGMTGTEEIYFSAFHLDVDGGVEVTASHNPIDYNGMKFVGRNAKPISGDTGLKEIQRIAENQDFSKATSQGNISCKSILDDYIEHILGYINLSQIKPLKLVVNAGNGAVGHVIDAIETKFQKLNVPITFIKIYHKPDGTFPNGIPNPLLPENRQVTSNAVISNNASMGIAWDGDFDRCFLFDDEGVFIEGYYIVGLIAETFLKRYPNEKIIHDPRLTWNTIDILKSLGGTPVQSKTGHAFIKERMRSENAIYGGEMSAHHYFRDFAYCDSGIIPWLIVAELISQSGKSLSKLVKTRVDKYPCSGEKNYKVKNATESINRIREKFEPLAIKIDNEDGLSLEFTDWRFNLRSSNTEPLLRLNVETRSNISAVSQYVKELETIILKSN